MKIYQNVIGIEAGSKENSYNVLAQPNPYEDVERKL